MYVAGHCLFVLLIFGLLGAGFPDSIEPRVLHEQEATFKMSNILPNFGGQNAKTRNDNQENCFNVLSHGQLMLKFQSNFARRVFVNLTWKNVDNCNVTALIFDKTECFKVFSYSATFLFSCGSLSFNSLKHTLLVYFDKNLTTYDARIHLHLKRRDNGVNCTFICHKRAQSTLFQCDCGYFTERSYALLNWTSFNQKLISSKMFNTYRSTHKSNFTHKGISIRNRRNAALKRNHKYVSTLVNLINTLVIAKDKHRLVDQKFFEPLNCDNIEIQTNEEGLALEYMYGKNITIAAVEVHVKNFGKLRPWILYISLDNRLCTRTTSRDYQTSINQILYCQGGQTFTGSVLTLEIVSQSIRQTNVTVQPCGLRPLICLHGLYGRGCMVSCHCLSCESMAGVCQKGCAPFFKGRNCGAVDISKTSGFATTNSQSEREKISTALKSEFSSQNVRWYAFKLAAAHYVSTVTLQMPTSSNFKRFQVYTLTTISSSNMGGDEKSFWEGKPCHNFLTDSRTDVQLSMSSFCKTETDTIVVAFFNPDVEFSFSQGDLSVWSCVDGTHGMDCEKLCNCKQATEICNKFTGHCKSGCPQGYSGQDCQIPCSKLTSERQTSLITCAQPATHCKDQEGFRPSQGSTRCLSGCSEGWSGRYCDISCSEGWYGHDCLMPCGDCKNGTVCDSRTGVCPLGCKDPRETSPICSVLQKVKSNATKMKLGLKSFATDKEEHKSFVRKAVLVLSLVLAVGAIVAFYLCGISIKAYFDDTDSDSYALRRKRLAAKRLWEESVNKEILEEHRDFFKRYAMRQKERRRSSNIDGDVDEDEDEFIVDPDNEIAVRKCLKDMAKRQETARWIEKARRQKKATEEHGVVASETGVIPKHDLSREEMDVKVAKWISSQDFEYLINRRKNRLKVGKENPLNMEESTYRISTVKLSVTDIHQLYDEASMLQIP